MNKEEVCKNCKFHYIEEISFDNPQSICKKEDKIHYTTEEWLTCNDFVYSEEYIKNLKQENKQLKERIYMAIEYIYHNSTRRKVFADIFDEYKNSEPKFYGNIKDLLEILEGENNEKV